MTNPIENQQDHRDFLLETALEYGKKGWLVFPCKGKTPLCKWKDEATCDEKAIRAFWQNFPNANIAVRTGPESGIFALDIDCKHDVDGFASLEKMIALHGQLPSTRTHLTPSDGNHLIFLYPENRVIRNSASKIGVGLDIRGDAGYIVMPPSEIDGKQYKVLIDLDPAPAPAWLLDAAEKHSLEPPKQENAPATDIPRTPAPHPQTLPQTQQDEKLRDRQLAYVKRALEKELENLLFAPEGRRNSILNNTAFSYGQWCGSGWFTEGETWNRLMPIALNIGLPEAEAKATIFSGLEAGKRNPRQPPNFQKHPAQDSASKNFFDPRMQIVFDPDLFLVIAKQVQMALLPTIFQYENTTLVKLLRHTEKTEKGKVVFKKGSRTLCPISSAKELLGYIVNEIRFSKPITVTGKNGREIPDRKGILPPTFLGDYLFTQSGNWILNNVSGIISCPIMKMDGNFLNHQDYDPDTALFCDFDPAEYRLNEYLSGENPLKTKFTPENAKEQAQYLLQNVLLDALEEFPFETSLDLSVGLAAMLSTVLCKSVPKTPLFAFSAPTPGTGKSTLADLMAIITTGTTAAAANYTPDQEAFNKLLHTILTAGVQVGLIDNVTGTFNNPTFNSILSQDKITFRLLGALKLITVQTKALWIMTGNNLTLTSDMTRRTIFATLNRNMERPQSYRFKRRNIFLWAQAHRTELVSACLLILKAYKIAGMPMTEELTPLVNYDDWSDYVRGALVWLDYPDPLDSQRKIEENDPIRESLEIVFTAWWNEYHEKWITAAELVNPNKAFFDSISNSILAPGHGKALTAQQLGKRMEKRLGYVVDGLKLEKSRDQHARITYYRLRKIDS